MRTAVWVMRNGMVFGVAAMLASLTALGFVPTAEAFPPVLTCEDFHPVVVGGFGVLGSGLLGQPVNYTSCYLPRIECVPPPGFTHCRLHHLAWISGIGLVQAYAGFGLLQLPPNYGCMGINSCTHVVDFLYPSGSLGTICQSGQLTEAAFVRLYCSIELVGFVA